MFQCKVVNVFSENSAYVVEFKSRKEVDQFVEHKKSNEYVDRVVVNKPTFGAILWRWFDDFTTHVLWQNSV
jgi:hypothetical protein